MKRTQRFSGRSLKTGLLLSVSGLAIGVGSPALAITRERTFLRWGLWENAGYTGENVIVAIVEPGMPVPNHVSYDGKISVGMAWPFTGTPLSAPTQPITQIQTITDFSQPGNIRFGRAQWNSLHATSIASALVGQDSVNGEVGGLVPDASVITFGFAAGLRSGATGTTGTSQAFALLAATHQPTANSIIDAINANRTPGTPLYERYKVASVVCSSFGRVSGSGGRRGEDIDSRVYNWIAHRTGATIVCPIGDDNELPGLDDLMPPEGTVASPGAAANMIGVGALNEQRSALNQDSGTGRTPVVHWFRTLETQLLDPDNPLQMGDPETPPMDMEFFEQNPGVSIVAPGTELTLAGSLAESSENPSPVLFGDFWTGTDYACAIVAGAAALVHDAGIRDGLWFNGKPSHLVTKAVLLNSAEKLSFNNRMMPDMASDVLITTQALDEQEGAGRLDLERLFYQFPSADVRDIKNLAGFILQPAGLDGILGNEDDNTQTEISFTGTRPDVAFTSYETLGCSPPCELPSFAGGGAIPPVIAPPSEPGQGAPAGAGDESQQPTQRGIRPGPGEGYTGRPGPGLGNGGSGPGGEFPPPPTNPLPGGPGNDCPNPPCGNDGRRFTGWDHGRLGVGTLDIPLGAISENSDIYVTLCWDRIEEMDMPNFAGPLHFIDSDLFVPSNIKLPRRSVEGLRSSAAEQAPQRPNGREMAMAQNLGWGRTVSVAGAEGAARQEQTIVPAPVGAGLSERGVVGPGDLIRLGVDDSVVPNAGLDIQFLLTPEAAANTRLTKALQYAASIWENRLTDDVTVTIMVDLIPDMPGVLAVTETRLIGADYGEVRQAMIDDASRFERYIANALPDPADEEELFFTTALGEVTMEQFGALALTPGNARALGFEVPPDPNMPFDARISVVQNGRTMDENPYDGILPNAIDLSVLLTREIGRTLGFVSGVDAFPDPASLFFPTALDLFRFSFDGSPALMTGRPETLEEFTDFRREFTPGVDSVFDVKLLFSEMGMFAPFPDPVLQDVALEYSFSTGQFNGDGRIAGSWLDDEITGATQVTGVFDPTEGAPTQYNLGYPKTPDLLALDMIGWDTHATTPTPPRPGLVENIGFNLFDGKQFLQDIPQRATAFVQEDLRLEVVRRSIGGGSDTTVAVSDRTDPAAMMAPSPDQNIAHLALGPNTGSGAQADIDTGNYFIRISWNRTEFDFGGWYITSQVRSLPQPGYRNFPASEIEYGLAWYVDLEPQAGNPVIANLREDIDTDGVVGSSDVALVLRFYGSGHLAADVNGDGTVDSADLARVLGVFGSPSRR